MKNAGVGDPEATNTRQKGTKGYPSVKYGFPLRHPVKHVVNARFRDGHFLSPKSGGYSLWLWRLFIYSEDDETSYLYAPAGIGADVFGRATYIPVSPDTASEAGIGAPAIGLSGWGYALDRRDEPLTVDQIDAFATPDFALELIVWRCVIGRHAQQMAATG